ncbi:MAG TPA: hypothetical protein VK428_07295, partial [Acidimicrobiales bacterium]|nr:hypothetical protein [Acidimicrobiales bacterium]
TATGLELSEKPEHGVRPLIIPRKGASPRFMPDNGVTQHDPQEIEVPEFEILIEPTDQQGIGVFTQWTSPLF